MHRITHCAAGAAVALLIAGASPALAATSCKLGNGIKHIVYLQFDNVHLSRDNPNVPSDLEQIPSLLNFLRNNGTLLSNHHTPLISHTSVDIVTSLTGVYGEKFGFAVGNSFGYFDPTGNPQFTSSFAYWTDQVNEGTAQNPLLVPQMVDQRGKVHPAPWVPFTRAGCDVGAFSVANIEFENTKSDVDNVFGPTSPEHNENLTNHTLARADFEGIAIHCAQSSPLCARSAHAKPDVLNDEPGGYSGFLALFGNKYVAPAINNGLGYVLDLDGHHITDSSGNDGFPSGFDPTPSQTLGYAAQMLEAGVPVVYFISRTRTITTTTRAPRPIRTAPSAPARRAMSSSCRLTMRLSASSSPGSKPMESPPITRYSSSQPTKTTISRVRLPELFQPGAMVSTFPAPIRRVQRGRSMPT